MNQDFQGRKIIVTGAATGIGRATAEALIAAALRLHFGILTKPLVHPFRENQ